jgi:uncharacterized protein YdeI (YjbR/CyaY-like superfamily)
MALTDVPADVKRALAADRAAGQRFTRLAPSHVREYLEWIAEAKQAVTRQRRIDGMIRRLKGPTTQRGNGEG